jgi:predicted negative regulator of RcsB-dependent stress response
MEQPHDDLQKKQELEQHEVTEVLGFLKRYGQLIGTGLAVAIVVALGSMAYRQHQTARTAAAEQALLTAQTPQHMEEILASYRSTPVTPVVLLNLAKMQFNAGETAQARAQYESFLKEYKKNEMRPVAELGLAYCTEADGDFDAAVEQFSAFVKAHTGSYLQPTAVLSIARCMEQAGRIDEARIVLEDFLTENAGTPWAGPAENALEQLNR